MQVTLEEAQEAVTAKTRVQQIQRDLSVLNNGVQSADPQLDVLERVLKWAKVPAGRDDIRTGPLLFLGLLLVLGSGVGLYAVTTPWRHLEAAPEGKAHPTTVGDAVV